MEQLQLTKLDELRDVARESGIPYPVWMELWRAMHPCKGMLALSGNGSDYDKDDESE